jgi:hypothetical protein
MFNMSDEDHRAYAVAGFHKLADFLHTYSDMSLLNTASRIDVQYSILEEDNDKAREEYNALSQFMQDVNDLTHAEFSTASDVYDDATHHIAMLLFGVGTVAYRVVWIERMGEAEDE